MSSRFKIGNMLFGTNPSSSDNENGQVGSPYNPLSAAKGVISSAAIGAPMLIAGAQSSKLVSSNEYRQIAGIKTNVVGGASATVGQNLKRIQGLQDRVRKANIDSFRNKFVKEEMEILEDLKSGTQQMRRQILNGILEGLNSLEADSAETIGLKEKIEELVRKETIEVDNKQEQALRRLFGQLQDSNRGLFKDISRNVNFYDPIANVLQKPLAFNGINSAFNTLDINDWTPVAERRMKRVRDAFDGSRFGVEAVLAKEKVGNRTANAIYAKITEGGLNGRVRMLPLDIHNVRESIGAPIVRVGSGAQGFIAPVAIGNADLIQRDFLSKGTAFSAADVNKSIQSSKINKAFMTIEDFNISLLEKVKKNKGKIGSDDLGEIFGTIRGMSENANRILGNDPIVQEQALQRYKGIGSKMAFELSGINPSDRRNFAANILKTQVGSGIVTGNTNLEIASLDNATVVNLALRNSLQIAGMSTYGVEDTYRVGSVKMPGVTEALVPLTARPKQYFNLENIFVDKQGEVMKDPHHRALMLLDMKEGRLGLSEGEGYMTGGNRKTVKILPKTVLDPESMGTASNTFLNKLIELANEHAEDPSKPKGLTLGSGSFFDIDVLEGDDPEKPGSGKFKRKKIGIGNIGEKKGQADIYFRDIGEFFRSGMFGNLQSGALFLGKMDGKAIEIPYYKGIEKLEVGIVEKTTETGADLLRISATATLDDRVSKIFSEHFKGTVKEVDSEGLSRVLQRFYRDDISFGDLTLKGGPLSPNALGEVGGYAGSIGAAEGSMLKKSHLFHATQMISAAEIYAAEKGYAGGGSQGGQKAVEKIIGRLNELNSSTGYQSLSETDTAKANKMYMSSLVQSVSEFMTSDSLKAKPTSSAEFGRIFGGFYTAFNDKKGEKTFSSLTSGEVIEAIEKGAKRNQMELQYGQIGEEIKKGAALALSKISAGPDIATYRANQASVEARMFNIVGFKLNQMAGFNQKEVSDFLFSILSRKTDAGSEIAAMQEYVNFQKFNKGADSIFDAKKYSEMERVDFTKLIEVQQEGKLSEYLESKKGSFFIDFDKKSAAGQAVKNVFGRDAVYVPAGKEFLDAISSQGTEIVKKDRTLKLEGEYKKQLGYFVENLSSFIGEGESTSERVNKAMIHARNYERKMSEISSNAFYNLIKGKLSGSASLRSAGIKLPGIDPTSKDAKRAIIGLNAESTKIIKDQINAGKITPISDTFQGQANINAKQMGRLQVLRDIASSRGNKGMTAFVDTQGFLATMSDFIEGAKKEYLHDDRVKNKRMRPKEAASYAAAQAKKDAAQIFQDFYLGGFEKYASNYRNAALTGIVTRHPILSTGHVQFDKLLRYDTIDKLGYDVSLTNLLFDTHNKEGRDALERVQGEFGKDIFSENNFEKLSNKVAAGNLTKSQKSALLGSDADAPGLFTYMSQNIRKFQNGEGGGNIFFEDMNVKVFYGDDGEGGYKSRVINLSQAQGAIGDFDGDLFQLIMLSKRSAKAIDDKVHLKGSSDMFNSEMQYRMNMRMIFDEAGEGINSLVKALGSEAVNPSKAAYDSAMKEIIYKDVGKLDVSLDSIRTGILNMDLDPSRLKHAQNAMAILTVLEEVGTIKAKKLPKALELGKAITGAFNKLYDTKGGDISEVKNIVENLIFKDTGIVDGMKIQGVDLSDISSKNMRDSLSEAFKGQDFDVNLKEIYKVLQEAGSVGNSMSSRNAKTARGAYGVFSNERQTRGALLAYNAMIENSIQGQLAGLGADTIAKQNEKIFGGMMDKVMNAKSTLGRRALGPAMLGVAAAGAIAGALGAGHSPEPLLMPGEVTDAGLAAKISSQNMFDNRGSNISTNNYRPESGAVNSRPININETYVKKNDNFMINGRLPDESAMMRVNQMMQSMGGSSNYSIQDTRGPITMNYINRISGE